MPVNNCTHIKVAGVRCGSPALRGEQFCYFHQGMLRGIKVPDSRVHHAALLEDEEAIQVSLMEVVNGLIRGTIELKRGELILRALNTAVRNIRRVKFGLHSDKMVREVPPEPAPPEPKPAPAPTHESTASAAAAYMAAVARSESSGDRLCGDESKPVRAESREPVRAAQKYRAAAQLHRPPQSNHPQPGRPESSRTPSIRPANRH